MIATICFIKIHYCFVFDVAFVSCAKSASSRAEANAQFLLGVMYRDGQGIRQDFKTVEKLFKLAAEQGMPLSHQDFAYRNFTTMSSGLGLVMAIYGPPLS